MEFKDLVNVVKGAVAGGVKREAEIVLDIGHGPMLHVTDVKALLGTQQLVIVAAKPARKPKLPKVLPGQRSMLDVWDKVKV